MVELRQHQKKAVEDLSSGKILYGGVGSGKTMTALAYYVKNESPKDILVITTAKKRNSKDWEKEAAGFGIGTERVGTLHGTITVDSWNNIHKYQDLDNIFLIADEQRVVGSGAWTKAFIKIARRNNWILLSATPGDTWLDYIPVFVANGFYKNRTEFKREHVVYNTFSKFPKVDRYVGVGKLVKLRNQILVEMPYEQHTTRKQYDIRVTYDKECLHTATTKRWHVYEDRPLRGIAELFGVMRKIVNSDPSRFLEVRKLIRKHPKVIIFYNFDYELEILRELAEEEPWTTSDTSSADTSRTPTPGDLTRSPQRLPERCTTNSSTELSDRTEVGAPERFTTSSSTELSDRTTFGKSPTATTISGSTSSSMPKPGFEARSDSDRKKKTFAVAEWNGHKHELIPDTDRWVYLVQYAAGAEGWNCIETDAMIFYSLTYSYKHWHQAFGRIDRMNSPFSELHYYVLRSDAPIDRAVWRALKSKKSFNESSLKGTYADTWDQQTTPNYTKRAY